MRYACVLLFVAWVGAALAYTRRLVERRWRGGRDQLIHYNYVVKLRQGVSRKGLYLKTRERCCRSWILAKKIELWVPRFIAYGKFVSVLNFLPCTAWLMTCLCWVSLLHGEMT
jgi:hypothetical protein